MVLSIKTTILAALVGLQLIAAGIIISSSFVTSETAVLRQAERLMRSIGDDTIQHTRRFLKQADSAVELSQSVQESDLISGDGTGALERFFFEQLRIFPDFSGLYLGDKNGQFTFVRRSTDIVGTSYQTKLITSDSPGAKLISRDDRFKKLATKSDLDDSFDPRERPWYMKAVKMQDKVWTAPYIFYTSQQPGITVAAPVSGTDGAIEGVVGIDVEIASISNFLADLEIGNSGAALILTRNGDVIAHPDSSKIKKLRDDGEAGLRFAKIHEIDDPIARAVVGRLSSETGEVDFTVNQFARVDVSGEVYDAVLMPFTVGQLDWTIAIYVPEADFLGSIIEGRTLNIAIAFSIACLTVLLGWFIARRITSPLTALSEYADQITREERANPVTLPGNFVEINHVSAAFGRMSLWLDGYRSQNSQMHAELAESAKKLEVRVDELNAEIVDRKRAEAQSQQLQNELAHVGRVATTGEMAASLAHELNQPLTAITQYCDLLINAAKSDADNKEEITESLEELQNQAFRAGAIIRELRQFIRKGETDLEQVNLAELIVQTVRLIEPQARKNNIDIAINVDEDAPKILINRVQIAQVLVNLMRNSVEAIKSAGSNPRIITIKTCHRGSGAEIIVEDTGPGLSSVESAFKPFETSKPDGMGIGLSISRTIIEAHQGRLTADPTVKRGARFRISLPGTLDTVVAAQAETA